MSSTLAMKMPQHVMFRAHLDERVCQQCRSLNRKVFNINKAPMLPLHDNCRCKLVNYKPRPRPKPRGRVEHIGESYWNVMFDKAQNLPQVISNNQRLKFRQEIQSLVKSYPYSQVDVMD